MKTRPFGKENFQVSEVGLGTWQLGSDAWGNVSDKQAEAILEAAVDQGITFFDTADVYGAGLSEKRIGDFLKKTRSEIFVATKLGRFSRPSGDINYTPEAFQTFTEASLKRLGVECLDLTQLHCTPIELLRKGEVFDWLRELKKQGKIKRFGASVESMEEALLCLEQDGLSSLQIIFNLFRQKPIHTLFEKAQEKGVALIIRLPVASGILTGKLNKSTSFASNDHRKFNEDGKMFNVGETFAGIVYPKAVELASELENLIPDGMTMAQMALRWILDHEAVSVIIPGATKTEQVMMNASVSNLGSLPFMLHESLEDFYHAKVKEHIRGPY